MDEFERLARALELFSEFRERPRPPEEWLAEHEHFRDLLEPMLTELDTEDRPTVVVDESSPIEPSSLHPIIDATAIQRSPVSGAVEQLGPYRMTGVLGEGGMGTVYRAEQTTPIRREVAVKVIRFGWESEALIARFEAERHALARMDHPNIAKVLEAGSTADRCPYFVMELVFGAPLTGYCNQHRLDVRQRAELLAAVCDGVQHAHQRGIIHRDLKPENVLVVEEGGTHQPKIIDFGIAKSIGDNFEQQTLLHTQTGALMGTPAYMSPEQIDPQEGTIDTRTDVYALGVILYELLVGELPFDPVVDSAKGIADFCELVLVSTPPKPSTRVEGMGGPTTIAGPGVNDSRSLARSLRGELDWIVLRCLEKDPGRRYESAASLATDLRRYLADEPIVARPPSRAYRLRKTLRRNRGLATALSLIFLSLIVGLGWALVEKSRADAKATELEQQAYASNLMLASAAVNEGQLLAARRHLLAAPERLRGWEWRHLWGRLDPSLRTIVGPTDNAIRYRFRSDGSAFIASSTDGLTQYLDAGSGRVLAEFSARGIVGDVRFNADESTLIAVGGSQLPEDVPTNGEDQVAGVWVGEWSVSTGDPLSFFEFGESFRVRRAPGTSALSGSSFRGPLATILPSSGWAVLSNKEQLMLFDLGSRSFITQCVHPGPTIPHCSNHRLWMWGTRTGDDSILELDPKTLAVRNRFVGIREARGMTVRTTEDRVAAWSSSDLFVWRVPADDGSHGGSIDPEFQIATRQGGIFDAIFSADGSRVITLGKDNSVKFWDSETGVVLGGLPVLPDRIEIVGSIPGTTEIFTAETNGDMRFWADRSPSVWEGHESFVYGIDLDAEHGLVATAGWDGFEGKSGGIRLWDAHSGAAIAAWGSDDMWSHTVIFDRTEAALITFEVRPTPGSEWGFSTETARVDLTTGRRRTLATRPGSVIEAFSTAAGIWTRSIRVEAPASLALIDRETGKIIRSIEDGSSWYGPIGVSADETRVAIVTGHEDVDATIRILDARTLDVLAEFERHPSPLSSLSFDPSDRRLLTAGDDKLVRVWDVETRTEIAALIGHQAAVLCAEFDPTGTRIASGGRDGTVRIWSAETYQSLATLEGHDDYVKAVEWTPDGRLLSVSGDGSVRAWEIEPARELVARQSERTAVATRLTPVVETWCRQHPSASADDLRDAHSEWTDEEHRIAYQLFLRHRLGRP